MDQCLYVPSQDPYVQYPCVSLWCDMEPATDMMTSDKPTQVTEWLVLENKRLVIAN